ncbi:MAG: entericidin A/B family lipoprotein [Xanthomonadales bacterium]|nr:entericidin A/B family lipoprotein [Xanthomonadales bacterium]
MRIPTTVWRLAALALGLLVLAGCNTIQGAGKDLQRAGEKIEEAARR